MIYNYNEFLFENKLKGVTKDDILNKLDTLSENKQIETILKTNLSHDLLPRDNGWCTHNGNLHLHDCGLTELPDKLHVTGYLNCSYNSLGSLPENLIVDGDLHVNNNRLKQIPNTVVINGGLTCNDNYLIELPTKLTYNGLICGYNPNLKKLPDNLTVNGYLDCQHNGLEQLPDNLIVNGNLSCSYNNITAFPNKLHVTGMLYMGSNMLTNDVDIPSDIYIGETFYGRHQKNDIQVNMTKLNKRIKEVMENNK